jgi:hypothetical protein
LKSQPIQAAFPLPTSAKYLPQISQHVFVDRGKVDCSAYE